MKTKLHLFIGKGGLLMVLMWVSLSSPHTFGEDQFQTIVLPKLKADKEKAPVELTNALERLFYAFELAAKQEAELKRKNEDLKRQLAEAKQQQQQQRAQRRQQQKEQRAQQWQAQKQQAKNLWKNMNKVPKGYSSWQQYHDEKRKWQMENSR